MLNRERILGADDLPCREIHIDAPGWEDTVRLKSLTGAERDAYEDSLLKGKNEEGKRIDFNNARAKLCVLVIIDEDGKRIFNDNDVEALGKKSALALDQIFSVAKKMNGLDEADINELIKNSEADQSDNSTIS